MTEEPENEDDLIFKAQNMEYNGRIEYLIPVQNENGSVLYVTRDFYTQDFYNYMVDNE